MSSSPFVVSHPISPLGHCVQNFRSMPLDGHSYLVSQGWAGKGSGLRHGAISRPLAIPQKKTLAGLGKDRDEAFPFWDHLFSAAAKSITLKVGSDDEDGSDSEPSGSGSNLKRTSTGILSNKRPITGISASTSTSTSGTSTPTTAGGTSHNHKSSLLSAAKREAARATLYAKFYRGPTLAAESEDDAEVEFEVKVTEIPPPKERDDQAVKKGKKRKAEIEGTAEVDGKGRKKRKNDAEKGAAKAKKKKTEETSVVATIEKQKEESKEERRRRRQEKKEKKERKSAFQATATDISIVVERSEDMASHPSTEETKEERRERRRLKKELTKAASLQNVDLSGQEPKKHKNRKQKKE